MVVLELYRKGGVSQRRVFAALQRLAETHCGALTSLDQSTSVRSSGNRSPPVDNTEVEFDPNICAFIVAPASLSATRWGA